MHGFACDHTDWRHQIDYFSPNNSILSPDLRAHGPMLVVQSTYLNAERKRAAMNPGETTPWLDLVRRKAPRARIEIIPGVGHFPQLEAPEQVNRLLSALV